MAQTMKEFRQHPLARPALIVPAAIMLIFSLFNLTAPPDPVRSAAAFRLGIVNMDEGLSFPPITVADRVVDNLGGTLPFSVATFEATEPARAALEAGDVAAVVVFPPEFSKLAIGDESFEIEVWNAQHLTIAETQMAGQLPMMIQMAMSGGVASLRLALAKGRLPSGQLPVTAKVTTLNAAAHNALLPAPFVLTFTSWLAALVGALLLVQASRGLPSRGAAVLRTGLPILSFGIAALVLACVVAATSGQWTLLLPVWLAVWPVALALGWLMAGLIALVGPVALLVLLPAAFYQSALGGVMAPVSAAPEWLAWIGAQVPFDAVGAYFRGVVHGTGADLPVVPLGGAAGLGLGLIWLTAVLRKSG